MAGCSTTSERALKSGVEITPGDGKLIVTIAGKPFTEYHYLNVSRPFLYPLFGPGGDPMTRNWPMADTPDEAHDHPHHRSFWYAHGNVNGQDFWSEEAKAGKTLHQAFTDIRSGARSGVIASRNNWVVKDGRVICTDTRKVTIYNRNASERLFDFEITIHADHGELTFGDTKEGTMAVRLNETMRLKGKVATGHIVNSEGVREDDTWGKRAKWCDYYGTVNGKTVGVAIFDHPSNPKHPTWWHVRDYGLFAANPFGLHDFEKKPAGAGNLVVPAGKSITFRYRFYLHDGNETDAKVERRFREYADENLK
jgi:hypothetical protein